MVGRYKHPMVEILIYCCYLGILDYKNDENENMEYDLTYLDTNRNLGLKIERRMIFVN